MQFWMGSKLLAHGTVDEQGYISVILRGKSFKRVGAADITVKLAPNADYYMDAGDNDFTITVG